MATKTNTQINGKDYYRIRRTVGHKDGKPVIKSFYGTSKGDAEQQYNQYLQEQAKAKYEKQREHDTMTFRDRADYFTEHVLRVSQRYSKGTKELYSSCYIRYIQDADIASEILSTIKAADIQEFYNTLDVSKQNMKNVHKFMSVFWKWLVRNDYADNILPSVEIPIKKEVKKQDGIVVWEDREIQSIIENITPSQSDQKRHRLVLLVYVLLYTGVRISEALALKYSDIEDDVITIQRQHYLGEIKPPKYNSVRQIPVHKELKRQLAEHALWHRQEMETNGYETEYLFTSSTGHLYSKSNIRRALVRFYDKNDIPHKHIHAYRATFCTNLCRCGVPLEVASQLMGHKSMEITAMHYALIRQETKRDAIDKLVYNINRSG